MNTREVLSAAKANLALAEKEVEKWKAVLAACGESTPARSKGTPARKRARKAPVADASGLTPIQKAQQARADAVAVQKGTATPEQIERHNARLAAKGASIPDPQVVREGASLVPA